MIAIIDYGVGNLFSLTSSLKFIGANAVVTDDKEIIRSADKLFLPGVGAFGRCSTPPKEAWILWVYASVCSFFLKKALNTANIRGLAF